MGQLCVYVYCWSPASIFFSAIYTETIYSFLTFVALLLLYKSPNSAYHQLVAAVIFSLSYLTRSNGFLNLGYIAFHLIADLVKNFELSRHTLRKVIDNL